MVRGTATVHPVDFRRRDGSPQRRKQDSRITGFNYRESYPLTIGLSAATGWFDSRRYRISPAVTKVLPISVPVEVTK